MKKFSIVLFILLNFSHNAQNSLPEWSKGVIWYQIFPERFANGDTVIDPHCRKPMFWSNLSCNDEIIDNSSGFSKGFGKYKVSINSDLLAFYKKLISIRNENECIKTGEQNFLIADNEKNLLAFERKLKDQKVIIIFNSGNTEQKINLPVDFKFGKLYNLLEDKLEESNPNIKANSFMVLK
jgi:glycosidase